LNSVCALALRASRWRQAYAKLVVITAAAPSLASSAVALSTAAAAATGVRNASRWYLGGEARFRFLPVSFPASPADGLICFILRLGSGRFACALGQAMRRCLASG
jgi:hypothetical protein